MEILTFDILLLDIFNQNVFPNKIFSEKWYFWLKSLIISILSLDRRPIAATQFKTFFIITISSNNDNYFRLESFRQNFSMLSSQECVGDVLFSLFCCYTNKFHFLFLLVMFLCCYDNLLAF